MISFDERLGEALVTFTTAELEGAAGSPESFADTLSTDLRAPFLRGLDIDRRMAAESRARHRLQPLASVGPYILMRMIGQGASGTVWEASEPSTKRMAAVKILHPRLRECSSSSTRFTREAEALGSISHPNVVQPFVAGDDRELRFIGMELVPGGRSVATVIKRAGEAKVLSEDYIRWLVETFVQAARGLHAAHLAGVLHRDIKPSNILLDGDTPKIADFGLASQIMDCHQTQGVGTPHYMAPEQLGSKHGIIDAYTDVWGLGATLYEALTLCRPFPGRTREVIAAKVLASEPIDPRQLNDEIPRDLAAVVLRALEKNSKRRYHTADLLSADLQRWLDGDPVTARIPSPLHFARSWTRRHPVVSAAVVLAIGLLTILGLTINAKRSADRRAGVAVQLQAETLVALEGERGDGARSALGESTSKARANFEGHDAQLAEVLVEFAGLAQSRGLHVEAVDMMEEAVALGGGTPERVQRLAASLLALERADEARAAVESLTGEALTGALSGALHVQLLDAILSQRDREALALVEADEPALPRLLLELEAVESGLPEARVQLTVGLYYLLREEFSEAEPHVDAAFYQLPRIEEHDDEIAAHLERALHALARVDGGLGRHLASARRFDAVHQARVERWGEADPRTLRVLLDQGWAELLSAPWSAQETLAIVVRLAKPGSKLAQEAGQGLSGEEPSPVDLRDKGRSIQDRYLERGR